MKHDVMIIPCNAKKPLADSIHENQLTYLLQIFVINESDNGKCTKEILQQYFQKNESI